MLIGLFLRSKVILIWLTSIFHLVNYELIVSFMWQQTHTYTMYSKYKTNITNKNVIGCWRNVLHDCIHLRLASCCIWELISNNNQYVVDVYCPSVVWYCQIQIFTSFWTSKWWWIGRAALSIISSSSSEICVVPLIFWIITLLGLLALVNGIFFNIIAFVFWAPKGWELGTFMWKEHATTDTNSFSLGEIF